MAQLQLTGIDCAACATKIEKNVNKMANVKSCSVNFTTQKLNYELTGQEAVTEFEQQLATLLPTIEPDVGIQQSPTPEPSPAKHAINYDLIRILVSSLGLAISYLVPLSAPAKTTLLLAAFVVIGYDIVWTAIKNILHGEWFDEHFLMSIATIGAFGIGQYAEAVGVMLFYQVGEYFQSLAVNHSRRSIANLVAIKPTIANRLAADGTTEVVAPEAIQVGEHIVVKPGEKVPLDGVITTGDSYVDTSAITGESVPRAFHPGDELLSGTINQSGLLTLEVTKPYADSTIAKILDLVENASSQKAPTENFITRFAKVYTPIVVGIAAIMAIVPPLLFGAPFGDWLYRALIFLVISCPCALVISIPLGFFAGIGTASKNGILVKGSNYLEALNDVQTVVFDKTGTLTQGSFSVTTVHSVDQQPDELLALAALVEQHSTHPIGQSILAANQTPLTKTLSDVQETAGHGISGQLNGQLLQAGKASWLQASGIATLTPSEVGTSVHVAYNNRYLGYIVIADTVKPDAQTAVAQLKHAGIHQTIMLTGDNQPVAQQVSAVLGIDKYQSELLPQDKVAAVAKLTEDRATNGKIVFVGDGINDTPVLARADVGVAMGGLGSDAAIEAADIVLMSDEPTKLATAISIAKYTRRIVWQNIIFALVVKGIFLLLGAFGIATMWEAVFADVGVTLIAILNALRILKKH
ncbi:cadmium-translocating P-type ATPase [Latilactobacillus curvatus]|uniref:Cd(2+)-exporting ATPase n=2 Tax=Latilactobacillus curvatus TaxID=28038 RepID=A0AAJ5UR63_LATCU|nr:heavy metal translocating P-type ATPase [Latilactobacillus curvatus]ANY12992.1 cadmium-translocating P-type ATPase [Latilactobacillus curvatus]EHE85830.1 cadmium-translocating P-type ATPase [Latilactobacillus curvatus CRL 705]KRK92556.1 cadmium-translocating P-type ATPase [Latilactobacillus curvatus JCM 1096 = DSM 20019]MCM0724598.1 cadmium-translocating P-type ATPase [Latilactobacillus curvatus]MCP8847758.1 cadmium-translocating P-type ATPase [Latilactobacillus curvatus]